MQNQNNKIDEAKEKIKMLLAENLGVESEDIKEEDFLDEDLHMNPAEITDFMQVLEDSGFDVSNIELSEIETVADLIEAALASNDFI